MQTGWAVMLFRRMPGGELEERLRAWVAARLESPTGPARGRTKRLAAYLRRPVQWVSMYKKADRDADFDLTLAILEAFNVTLDDLKRNTLPDELDVRIWEVIRQISVPKKRFVLDVADRLKKGEQLVVGTQQVAPPAQSQPPTGNKSRGKR